MFFCHRWLFERCDMSASEIRPAGGQETREDNVRACLIISNVIAPVAVSE
jgi:hypothetical protein